MSTPKNKVDRLSEASVTARMDLESKKRDKYWSFSSRHDPLSILLASVILFSSSIFFSNAAWADESIDDDFIISLTVENDAFVNSDRYYTNGIRLEYAREKEDGFIAGLMQGLFNAKEGTSVLQSFAVGQSIFTPDDISAVDPIFGQRPYAGYLFADMTANVEAKNGTHWVLAQIGLTGPSAGGEDIQNWWHSAIIDRPEALGWDNQISDEVGFVIAYDRQFSPITIYGQNGKGVDLTPHAGVALGTIHTDARVGATIRAGSGLNNDIGPPRIKPAIGGSGYFHESSGFDAHLFAGVETRFVAHDIFLDGSLFKDTLVTVDSKAIVTDLQVGTILQYRDIQLSLAYVYRTREYSGQENPQKFTSFAISKRF